MSTFFYRLFATIGAVVVALLILKYLGIEPNPWMIVTMGGLTGIGLAFLDRASVRRYNARAAARDEADRDEADRDA